MVSTVEVTVFTDTNLGTHIAMAVPPDITAGDFKRELERTHLSCFPKLGEIKVHRLMVKRRLCLYHLPESMPIKHVFQGRKGTWFLHLEAGPMNGLPGPSLPNCAAVKVVDGSYVTESITANLIKSDLMVSVIKPSPAELLEAASQPQKRKKKKRESKFLDYGDDAVENGCPTGHVILGSNPRERLRKKEKQPKAKRDDILNSQADDLPQFAVRTPPKESPFLSPTNPRPGISRNKYERSEVGRRLIVASSNLRISAKKQRPATPVYRCDNGKPLCCSASSLSKYLVFEISDCED